MVYSYLVTQKCNIYTISDLHDFKKIKEDQKKLLFFNKTI